VLSRGTKEGMFERLVYMSLTLRVIWRVDVAVR
jgi:hypothetical protein